jgi:hypothetical protein
VVNWHGQPLVLLRAVNYRIRPDGSYDIRDGSSAIRTRNYLLDTHDTLGVPSGKILTEIPLPANWPHEPKFDLVRGLEDCRLFVHDGHLRVIATARELDAAGTCQMVLLSLGHGGFGDDWTVLPSLAQHEKNWMPLVNPAVNDPQFVYRLGTVVDATGAVVARHDNALMVEELSGGTPVIMTDGACLALVHEARITPGKTIRYYNHRFVRMDLTGRVLAVSPPFLFHAKQIEFAAGLAYFPGTRELMVSFGVMDREAWTASMKLDEVLAFIGG